MTKNNSTLGDTADATSGKLVPVAIPIGLLVLIVLFAGLGFLFMPKSMLSTSLIAKVLGIYLLGIPALFLLAREVINRFFAEHWFGGRIHFRNSLTLGLLMSFLVILWQMSAYS